MPKFAAYPSAFGPLDLAGLCDLARAEGMRVIRAYKPDWHVYNEIALFGSANAMRRTRAAWAAAGHEVPRGKPPAAFGIKTDVPFEEWVDAGRKAIKPERRKIVAKTETKPVTGPVFEILQIVSREGGRSPRTDAAAVRGFHLALAAAIRGGLRWTLDDAREIGRTLSWTRGQYRFGIDAGTYRLAVEAHNESACRSIERYLGVAPWRWPNQSPDRSRPDRIALGSRLFFEGGWWEVTTWEQDRLILCLYDENARERGETRRPLRRRTLTRADVQALLDAAMPEPVPPLPPMGLRYEPVHVEKGLYGACSCSDRESETQPWPCWACARTREADERAHTEKVKAAKRAAAQRPVQLGGGSDDLAGGVG